MKKIFFTVLFSVFCLSFSFASVDVDQESFMGIPMSIGGSDEPDLSLCPHGAKVISIFMAAWEKHDYTAMYELIDEESQKKFSFETTKFEFQFMKFKEYKISSVKRSGDNFDFIISAGDWQTNDKDTKKIVISGKSYKIILDDRGMPFRESMANYI